MRDISSFKVHLYGHSSLSFQLISLDVNTPCSVNFMWMQSITWNPLLKYCIRNWAYYYSMYNLVKTGIISSNLNNLPFLIQLIILFAFWIFFAIMEDLGLIVTAWFLILQVLCTWKCYLEKHPDFFWLN